jgi:hypothetical protein
MGPLLVDLPSLTSFRKSYLFHSLNLGACSLHLIEWDRIDIVERWIDTDQSLHLDTDQETVRDNLRRTGFDWWSILLNLIDHSYSWWNQRSSSGIFLIFDSDFYLFISLLSLPRSPRTNLISRRSILLKLVQSYSCRSAARATSIPASHPCNLAFYSAYQAVKPLQWRQILNHS